MPRVKVKKKKLVPKDTKLEKDIKKMEELVEATGRDQSVKTLNDLHIYLKEMGHPNPTEVITRLAHKWGFHVYAKILQQSELEKKKKRTPPIPDSELNPRSKSVSDGAIRTRIKSNTDPVLAYFREIYHQPIAREPKTRCYLENAIDLIKLHKYLEKLEKVDYPKGHLKRNVGLSGRSTSSIRRVINEGNKTVENMKKLLGADNPNVKELEKKLKKIRKLIEYYENKGKIWW